MSVFDHSVDFFETLELKLDGKTAVADMLEGDQDVVAVPW